MGDATPPESKRLFIIPARGGSKRFADKNRARYAGVPLLGSTILAAQAAARLLAGTTRIVVSTDSHDLAEIARAAGAEVPFLRPQELSSDTATSVDVVNHCVAALGGFFDQIVLLQPTSPLIEGRDITAALELHNRVGTPVVAMSSRGHPLTWQYWLQADGSLEPVSKHVDDGADTGRALYEPTGAIYITTPQELGKHGSLMPGNATAFVVDHSKAVDVDFPSDLAAAEGISTLRSCAEVQIGTRKVGPNQPCFVIAEAGVNHNGSIEMALKLVDAAADAGADAVKFQTFKSNALVLPGTPTAEYQRANGGGASMADLLKPLELDRAAHLAIMARCAARSIMFLSTPFDDESLDLLMDLGIPALKIASPDLVNLPLLWRAAKYGKPLILSTGGANFDDVDLALCEVRRSGAPPVMLLHCVSSYPAPPESLNLRSIQTLRQRFGVPVGLSDHSTDAWTPLVASALGSCILERHITLDRTLPGPDHAASTEPHAFKAMIQSLRDAELALGDGHKRPTPAESANIPLVRRSLVARCNLTVGTVLEAQHLTALRPASGVPASSARTLLGRKVARPISAGQAFALEDIE